MSRHEDPSPGGKLVVTDGPFTEAKEVVGGDPGAVSVRGDSQHATP